VSKKSVEDNIREYLDRDRTKAGRPRSRIDD
jgi:hypothetical protein